MKIAPDQKLANVQAVYSGPEGRLWELIMGEQIHIGGLNSSADLARRAEIQKGMTGIDLCCASGAGMRYLVRFHAVARMTGVDATPFMTDLGIRRTAEEGLSDRISFVQANVCATGLPSAGANFIWGEDAWCYVEDKAQLITESVRLVPSGGVVAFTDWVEGTGTLTDAQASRFLAFMKFPSMLKLEEYSQLLRVNGCDVLVATDTGRFAPAVALYLEVIEKQLTYDTLKIIGFDGALAETLLDEMRFTLSLARESRIAQGLIVARKR
jgi:SAM-dependent methyltransferase